MMEITRIRYMLLSLLTAGLGLAACSSSEDEPLNGETCAVQFSLSTQGADTNHPVQGNQLMRLFIGERKPEHGVEELHLLGVMEDVKEGKLTFTNLKPQWYKFAFVCVPRNGNNLPLNLFTEENPGEATCDMNRILLDYAPLMALGAGSEDYAKPTPLPPGDIYRKVVSLWLEKGVVAKENVVLNRLNGQIVVDMGILVDQFEHPVDSIVLELYDQPTRMYITDNDKGEIKTTTPRTVRFTTIPDEQKLVDEFKRKHHKLIANLLPCELDGKIIVYTKGSKGMPDNPEFSLRDESENIFRIKPNTRTILHFNGISEEYFDVKYAGFKYDSQNDTEIDADGDDWDGWDDALSSPLPPPSEQTPKP